MTAIISNQYVHVIQSLTVDALNICSLPKYLCRYSRIGIADRRAHVAASTKAPAEVMFGMKLRMLYLCGMYNGH
jgi:hypothetical protein